MKPFLKLLTALLAVSLTTSCASTGEDTPIDDTTTETSATGDVDAPKSGEPKPLVF